MFTTPPCRHHFITICLSTLPLPSWLSKCTALILQIILPGLCFSLCLPYTSFRSQTALFRTQSARYVFTHLFTVYALPHNGIALDIIAHSRPDSQTPLAPYAVTRYRSPSHRFIRSMPMLRSPFQCMPKARLWQFRTSHGLSPECFQVFSLPKAERKT